MRSSITAGAVALALAAAPAARADGLPVLSGRWSPGPCGSEAGARWFAPGATASADERCRVTVTRAEGRVFGIHLDCRYRAAAADRDDAVIEVESPSALRWIDGCTATRYRFCARDGLPGPFAPRPR